MTPGETIGKKLLPLIQRDIAQRGLASKPENLFNALPDDLDRAINDLAKVPLPKVAIITGFYIPDASPPTAETDGPLGAIFLARTLSDLGAAPVIGIEREFAPAIQAGLRAAGLGERIPICELPLNESFYYDADGDVNGPIRQALGDPEVIIFIERVGWARHWDSLYEKDQREFLREFGRRDGDHRYTMRGIDINKKLAPTDLLAELDGVKLRIGIGDGGNEIGMGKISWSVIRENIPNGGLIACGTATDHLIVAGISNWGGYALGVGLGMKKGRINPAWFDVEREKRILEALVGEGGLVDGVTGRREATVDGIDFDRYIEPLVRMQALAAVEESSRPKPAAAQADRADLTTGEAVRAAIRSGRWSGPTPGLAPGYVQANLVVLPQAEAYDFLLFCQRNPKPCPLLDVTDAGSPIPLGIAPNADLRIDLPKYLIYRNGQLTGETDELTLEWRADLVSFLIGCSFTFENALLTAGLPVRHLEQGRNVPMYRTNIACRPAGRFSGPMVVSMRPMTPEQAKRAAQICARFPLSHGAPVHIGDPAEIGITDIQLPDYGDAVDIRPGEVCVFWACGVTPQAVAVASKIPFLMTHKPGHMFLSDVRDTEQEIG